MDDVFENGVVQAVLLGCRHTLAHAAGVEKGLLHALPRSCCCCCAPCILSRQQGNLLLHTSKATAARSDVFEEILGPRDAAVDALLVHALRAGVDVIIACNRKRERGVWREVKLLRPALPKAPEHTSDC